METSFKPSIYPKLRKLVCFLSLVLLTFTLSFKRVTNNNKLILRIDNVKKSGVFYVSLCAKASEWANNGRYTFMFESKKEKQNVFEIDQIPNGEYAIAFFQDTNGNGVLDTNSVGYPKEPFGFSNDRMPIFSVPSFSKCKFEFKHYKQIKIKLVDR
ncbi:MAG: DUF2141 domain-containing protein [Leadbetterella sp.]